MREEHGLIIEHPQFDHYMVGGLGDVPQPVLQADRDWTPFLPKEEIQSRGTFESFNCTRYGTYHGIAMLMRRLFGPDVDGDYNWSERFGGVVGNTTVNGNSPHTAGEDVRHFGLLDDMYLPFLETIDSWEAYYTPKPMTQFYLDRAAKWPYKKDFKHDWTITGFEPPEEKAQKIYDGLQYSPQGVAVYAWELDEKTGMYIRTTGSTHWVVAFRAKKGEYFDVLDTYAPFIKRLSWNHIATTEMAKRYYLPNVKKNEATAVEPVKWAWLRNLLKWLHIIK